MDSVNFAVLGEQSVAAEFGKKGTATDLALYDKKEAGAVRTWVAPIGFPDKIQPLFQAISLAEYVVFYVSSLDKFAGEQVLALDMLQKTEGVLAHTYDVDEDRLNSMIKGRAPEKYKRAEPSGLREAMAGFSPAGRQGKPRISIDHCFDVKGVGAVLLGKVTQGTVAQYDKLVLMPSGKEVLIKSIQMHDEPVESASSPARVGLSIKGAAVDEVSRGDILCNDDSVKASSGISVDYAKNPFYKGDFAAGQTCLASIGLQIRPVKIESADPVRLSMERPAALGGGETCVMLRPESETVRMMGSGAVL